MKTQIASATKIMDASVEEVYRIIADYRNRHPQILPQKYFLSLEVEEGGIGEGTIVNFTMRLLGQIRSFRALISEPNPGHILQETDLASGVVTRFVVSPADSMRVAEVTISTELKGLGRVEGFLAKTMLQKVYREELNLLARLAENHHALTRSASIGAPSA